MRSEETVSDVLRKGEICVQVNQADCHIFCLFIRDLAIGSNIWKF